MSMLFRRLSLVITILLLSWTEAKAQTTNYVSVLGGDDTYDGLTWQTAKKSISSAVNAASPGATILVSNGIYYVTSEIVISKAVTLLGVGGPAETIIDGSNACRCVHITDGGAVIEGFSIRNGLSGGNGAGIYGEPGGILRNCHVYGNVSSSRGGGVYLTSGTIEQCRVFSNSTSSTSGGGGIYLLESGTVRQCDVYGNYSAGSGGGTRAKGGTFEDCLIHDNSAGWGGGANVGTTYLRCKVYRNNPGGVWLVGGTMQDCQIYSNGAEGVYVSNGGTLRNCLLYNNAGVGISLTSTNTTVENCTITGNSNGVSVASGIFATNVFRNVILSDNVTGPGGMDYVCDSNAVFACEFSCVSPIPSNGVGNIDVDPLFMDAAQSDFRLRDGSPCIDLGTNLGWMASATAIGGQPRIFNGRVDMGADETAFLHVWTNSLTDGPGTRWSNAFHTIQGAVDASIDLVTVLVTNGTYVLTNRIAITNGVTVRSTGGKEFTTVDGNHAVGCFAVTHSQAVVEGFTITKGSNTQSYMGGGVYLSAGIVQNCAIVSNNSGFRGGGVYFDFGGVLSNCTIHGNSAEEGAGLLFESGGVVIGSIVSSNVATGRGGGMRFFNGGILEGSTVIGNTGTGGGGSALRFDSGGVVTNCTITRNTSADGGGVIRFSGGGSLYDCTISSNSSSGKAVFEDSFGAEGVPKGLAIRCTIAGNAGGSGPSACAFMKDCTIAGNQATNGNGGGLTLGAGKVAVGCLIVGNSASQNGGGVQISAGGALVNCTIAGNTAGNGAGGISFGGGGIVSNSIVYHNQAPSSPEYNVGGGTFSFSCTTPPPGGSGNTTNDPRFLNAPGGDFRLATNSPCIDKGTNAVWMTSDTDLDGKPRIIHDAVDMGAFETILPSWDTDSDSIPDLWTWEHFGHLTGLADDLSRATDSADGTGVNNLYKYTADLDPTNPVSVFKIVAVSYLPPNRLVYFQGSSNRVYTLNWSTNLVSGSWTNVPEQINVKGNGPSTSLIDTNAANLRFYQVEVRVP